MDLMTRRRAIMSKPITHGKNLLNIHRPVGTPNPTTRAATVRVMSTNEYFCGISINNYYRPEYVSCTILSDGVFLTSSAAGYGVMFPVACTGDTAYTLSCSEIDTGINMRVTYFTEGWEYISFDQATVQSSNLYMTYTTPSNCKYICVVISPSASAAQDKTVKNIQLELGSVATEYEPYI